jgi:hypothetical protein
MPKESPTSNFDHDALSLRQKARYGIASIEDEDEEGGSDSGSSGQIEVVIPFSERKTDRFMPLVDEWGQELARLVKEKGDEFTQLIMQGQSQFGAVSTQRKRNKKSRERAAEHGNQAGMSPINTGGLPQHPLLNGQRYDGMGDDSPLPSVSAQDELFGDLAEQIERHPELKLSPELSNDLKLRIELYNRQKLENALRSRPVLTRDRVPGR